MLREIFTRMLGRVLPPDPSQEFQRHIDGLAGSRIHIKYYTITPIEEGAELQKALPLLAYQYRRM